MHSYEAFDDEDYDIVSLDDAKSDGTTEHRENWDLFEILPPDTEEDEEESTKTYEFVLKILKVITYLVTFLIVLSSSIISKIVTVLMTSQLDPNRIIPYCNKNFGSTVQFISESTQAERIAWTWCIYFVYITPEIQTFLRSFRIWYFKGGQPMTFLSFSVPFLMETLHTIGLAALIFTVLPHFDAVKAIMLTNCVALLPAILGMISRFTESEVIGTKTILDITAIIFQFSGLIVWPLFAMEVESKENEWFVPAMIPISLLLVSCGWWENFVDVSNEPVSSFMKGLGRIKNRVNNGRYSIYFFISIWKMILFLGFMYLFVQINENIDKSDKKIVSVFEELPNMLDSHFIVVSERGSQIDRSYLPDSKNVTSPSVIQVLSDDESIMWSMVAHILASYFCFIIGKFTCKILIQNMSFAFPILLAAPVSIFFVVIMCGMRDSETCFWESTFPGYLFWTCPRGDIWEDFFAKEHGWIWILWFLSQVWITYHIWNPEGLRMASSETLFVTPMYNSLLIDQSLALNRRRDEKKFADGIKAEEEDDIDKKSKMSMQDGNYELSDEIQQLSLAKQQMEMETVSPMDSVPKIYACATMWHETKEEMIEMLKSIFRMDCDNHVKKVLMTHYAYQDPEHYEFESELTQLLEYLSGEDSEAHIFFDDAFKLERKDPKAPKVVNDFVRTFLGTLEEAGSHVLQRFIKLKEPKIIPTPYGGRLEWTLPGKTKLICHLKDKDKIRHKKRWSQCMYMYYLLGYKLMDTNLSTDRKEVIARNTFILALDGDIDFHPNAVRLLVDLMRKNRNLGAACGRIHPVGSGPMVWYQKFEYAVGHWLQKATEHVTGCVLCSPGCFSLFRAKALMDDNVMAKYTTISTEARHYVQYDQGEDRWLCTLLLQRGWRVEYSAASDAKTHSPETFNEFYNQRRRWVPSTMANILDLLMDYKKTVRVNPNISNLYIAYQIGLLVGSILGPGTIFLMLVGAFATAFNLDQWTSFFYNFIPILFFIIVCFFFKSEIQLTFAQIISVMYALVMVAVVVAIALQVSEDGLLAPSSIFLVIVASSFIIAGIIHPLEFDCLPFGLLYYITIPSMYLLLIVYSLFNLNNVSWGTRETPEQKSKAQLEAEAKAAEEAKKKKKVGFFMGLMTGDKSGDDRDGSIEFSFAGLFKVMCCLGKKDNSEAIQLGRIADSLDAVNSRLDVLERNLVYQQNGSGGKNVSFSNTLGPIHEEGHVFSEDDKYEIHGQDIEQRDDIMNPYWMEDDCFEGKSEPDFLTEKEINFWKGLIQKYLEPIPSNPTREKQIATELKQLRNNVVFAFFMFNAIFVILIFLLQLEKDTIHVNWPFGADTNVTFITSSDEILVSREFLELEPIGFVFLAFFGLVLGTQFIGMIVHRLGTISHLMAATTIDWCAKDVKKTDEDLDLLKVGTKLIKSTGKGTIPEEGPEHDGRKSLIAGRRKTIHNLESKKVVHRPKYTDLDEEFRENVDKYEQQYAKNLAKGKRQSMAQQLINRRVSIAQRRKSLVEYRRNSRTSVAFEDQPLEPQQRLYQKNPKRMSVIEQS